jgi:hypothetical protein
VDSQRGALVIWLDGQVRSGRSIGVKGRYRWKGIGLGCWTGTDCCRVPKLTGVVPVDGLVVMK